MSNKFYWESLNEKWTELLLSSNFKIKDCERDGNCQFYSLSQALKYSELKLSHRKLRKLLSDYIIKISDVKFKDILQSYILEQEHDEFHGDWNPSLIKTKKQLAKEIKKVGFNFEGDYTTLSLLSIILKIDFILFNENDKTITKIENVDNKKLILLNFIQIANTGHYQTIGLQTNKKIPITIFNKEDLPKELVLIFNKNKFFTKHIKNIMNEFPNVKCNEIISKLSSLSILSKSDKKVIYRVLAKLV